MGTREAVVFDLDASSFATDDFRIKYFKVGPSETRKGSCTARRAGLTLTFPR
jgi:hypothetical protein